MKKMLCLIVLLLFPVIAQAAEPAIPADPVLVSVLVPGCRMEEGNINPEGNELRLLMRKPDGALVFVGGVHNAETGWKMTQSTPLPEGTRLGVENFVYSLGIGESDTLVSMKPYPDGRWGVSLIYPENAGLFRVGPNWLMEESGAPAEVGDHPWDDITTIDWNTLPQSYEEALLQVDHTRWAMVRNPDPKDRLNLRVKPDKQSISLGKYYNGAPVRIAEIKGAWARVNILGVEGWMMTEYLAIGEEMKQVAFAGPWLQTEEQGAALYAGPEEETVLSIVQGSFADMQVIGCVNEQWYHVWFYEENTGGYFRAEDLWAGNG